MQGKLKIWERQPDETEKAYSAFKIFLEMEDRSISKVAKYLSVSVQNVRKWSSKYDWFERAASYDSSIVEVTRKLKISAIKETIRRKTAIAGKLEEKALKALDEIKLNRISGRTIVEMLTLANQLRDEAMEVEKLLDETQNETPVIVIKDYDGENV